MSEHIREHSRGTNSNSEKIRKILKKDAWDTDLGILMLPLERVIPLVAELALKRNYINPNYDLLYKLKNGATDDQVDNAVNRIKSIAFDRWPNIKNIDLTHIPGRLSPIIKAKIHYKNPQITKIEKTLDLVGETGLSVNPNAILLLPGVIVGMPFGVDVGTQVGELYGNLYAYSWLQARWKQTTMGGYIEVSSRYGAIRHWDTDSEFKINELAEEVEKGKILAHLLQAKNMKFPLIGGLPGLGKRS